jgi:hypothetical protein
MMMHEIQSGMEFQLIQLMRMKMRKIQIKSIVNVDIEFAFVLSVVLRYNSSSIDICGYQEDSTHFLALPSCLVALPNITFTFLTTT